MSAVLKSDHFADIAPQRYNIYTIIHKGLRGFMTDTLLRWGKADMNDEQDRVPTIAQVRGLLEMCQGHLHHENTFVHPAMEAAEVGSSANIANEHVEHEAAIAALQAQLGEVEAASDRQRAELAQQFYLRLSIFVAENFEHMAAEETHNHAVLIGAYSDSEILEAEHRIVATIPPEKSVIGLRWMLGHINATERAFMLGGMKRNAPPPAFNAVMNLAREVLTERDFNKLEAALA